MFIIAGEHLIIKTVEGGGLKSAKILSTYFQCLFSIFNKTVLPGPFQLEKRK